MTNQERDSSETHSSNTPPMSRLGRINQKSGGDTGTIDHDREVVANLPDSDGSDKLSIDIITYGEGVIFTDADPTDGELKTLELSGLVDRAENTPIDEKALMIALDRLIADDDLFGLVKKMILSHTHLTSDEQLRQLKILQNGYAAAGKSHHRGGEKQRKHTADAIFAGKMAEAELMVSNSRLVFAIARRFTGRGLSFLDLMQEGFIGLQRTYTKFDPDRGYKLSTYSYWYIRGSIINAIHQTGRLIRLPVHIIERISRMSYQAVTLRKELGRDPNDSELAGALEISIDQLHALKNAAKQPISFDWLNKKYSDDERNPLNMHADAVNPERYLEWKELRELLMSRIRGAGEAPSNTLSRREAIILTLRFGLDGEYEHTLAECARRFNITRERVRKIQNSALKKLGQDGLLLTLYGHRKQEVSGGRKKYLTVKGRKS